MDAITAHEIIAIMISRGLFKELFILPFRAQISIKISGITNTSVKKNKKRYKLNLSLKSFIEKYPII